MANTQAALSKISGKLERRGETYVSGFGFGVMVLFLFVFFTSKSAGGLLSI